MKTKVFAGICAIILSVGIGTAVYAAEVGPGTFRDMLPFMREMHPNLGDSELEQMYNGCRQQGEWNSNSSRMMYKNPMMRF
ncbi:hypothetical protein [Paenibacillus sp.]|uniref:hypothetical protein n=1 Tax=Paenibacillus sp. TaxID=58172 RepID=UPI002824A1AA|nr:hypothetical protein [Paenibacillus sp.]MDR0269682.1 hypothetical protein [Paenibacillus sp.]